jgi:serine/threonine protein phosphatase 1
MIYAIGDVHGEAAILNALIEKLPLDSQDLVVFLGDLINRGGLDPFACLETVINFDRCKRIYVQGNHEEAMAEVLRAGTANAMAGMRFQNTVASYQRAGYSLTPGDLASIPASHVRVYLQEEAWTLPYYITDDYIFTHAGWDLSQPEEYQRPERLRWEEVIGFERPVWTQTVVRGHTPIPKVRHVASQQYIGVDTGCGHGGYLSAVALPTGRVYTAGLAT